ncbi:MAG: hypothetical protein PHP17_07075, partial [Candidatus Omnitrophica bacterium]|nr:hypothetical protein [Candidatus Omnitrophota bacterium]
MQKYIKNLVKKAREASYKLAKLDSEKKNAILFKMADCLLENKDFILAENAKDVKKALKNKLQKSFIDRLTLSEKRLAEMSESLKEIAKLPDPVGKIIEQYQRPNGLKLKKVRAPIGVIFVIFEARPNVTSDCAGLLFKSSNIAILRGGADSVNSNKAIAKVLRKAIEASGLDFEPFYVDQLRPKYLLPVTGTPMRRNPSDLFTVLHLLDRNNRTDCLHSFWSFVDKWCIAIKDVFGYTIEKMPKNTEEFKELLSRY